MCIACERRAAEKKGQVEVGTGDGVLGVGNRLFPDTLFLSDKFAFGPPRSEPDADFGNNPGLRPFWSTGELEFGGRSNGQELGAALAGKQFGFHFTAPLWTEVDYDLAWGLGTNGADYILA